MIDALIALHSHSDTVQLAERIELKRVKSGHFRLYVPVPIGFSKADASQCIACLANLPVSCNPFNAGGRVKSLTITDDSEGNDEITAG